PHPSALVGRTRPGGGEGLRRGRIVRRARGPLPGVVSGTGLLCRTRRRADPLHAPQPPSRGASRRLLEPRQWRLGLPPGFFLHARRAERERGSRLLLARERAAGA